MLEFLLIFSSLASAAESSSTCIEAAKITSLCCQNPVAHATDCLSPSAQTLNKRLQAFQDALAHPGGGLKDAGRERRAQLQAYKDSAALNTSLAESCERFVKACQTTCAALPTSEGKAAAEHCQDEAKAAAGFRAQAERDQALVKRGERRGTR